MLLVRKTRKQYTVMVSWTRNNRSCAAGAAIGAFSTCIFVFLTSSTVYDSSLVPVVSERRTDCRPMPDTQLPFSASVIGPSLTNDGKSDKLSMVSSEVNARKNRRPNVRALKLTNNALEAIANEPNALTEMKTTSDDGLGKLLTKDGLFLPSRESSQEELNFQFRNGLTDVSRKYHIHPFAKTAEKWGELVDNYPLCMATQTSVSNLKDSETPRKHGIMV